MTFGELIDQCSLRTGFNDSAYRNRWGVFINDAIREFSRRQPWPGLEDYVTLRTDGSKYLILPHYVDTVLSLLNLTDSLPIERTGDFEKTSPAVWSQGTSGRPAEYTDAGEVATTQDPAGYLWFNSTHASDLQNIYITGLVAQSGASGALERTFKELSVSAAGTSPVTISQLFVKVFSIGKATDANGDFFFRDAGTSNAQISYLGRTDSGSRFRRLAFIYKPPVGNQIELRFRYKIPKLTQDAQAPHPNVKPDFVIQHAISLHWAEQEQLSKSQASEQKANRVLEAESNKENNFNEPYNQLYPWLPDFSDAADDLWRQW